MADNTTSGFRLSMQQERIWAQQQSNSPYLAQCIVMIDGPLNSSTLRESLNEVVRQHEVLRTVFHRQSGLKVPFQVILDSSEPTWNMFNLISLTEPVQKREIDDIAARGPALDLQHGPLVQASLIVLSAEKHAFILSVPSLLSDARSLENLVIEIGRNYAAALAGQKRDSEAMQYVDVVQWQTDLLESEESKACRDFWRDFYRKVDVTTQSSLVLPFEMKSDASKFQQRVIFAELAPDVLHRLESVCSQLSTSPADLLLASWATLLARLSGKTEIVLGSELNGRKYEELEEAIGLFAKSVPLQVRVESDLAFVDVLRQTIEAVSEANQWQEGFTWTHLATSTASGDPTFLPIAFQYLTTGSTQFYGDLSLTIMQLHICQEPFKLKLFAVRGATDLRLEFHYDPARLDSAEVTRIAGHFVTLLASTLECPETPVCHLPLLSDAERHQLLISWNETKAPYPQDKCLHQLFEAQATRTPDRLALRFNDCALSYRELNEQSNQLAHYLRSLGVGPDSLVGLCLDRSTGLLVALLGTLKAGGAYVPLNADNPKPRLAQQLTEARVLITEQKLLPQMPDFAGKTICLDREQYLWADQSRSNRATQTTPENLAYVLYTSGSTGLPKGVAVKHRNLVNYSHFITQFLQLHNHPDGLQFATVSTIAADLGNTCIYPSLISGGCLHLISYDVSTDAQSLARYTTQYPIDVLKIVPSHLQALLQSPGAKQILPRRYLIMGGEALSPKLLETILSLDPSCEVLNHYGPTETTVGSLTQNLREYDPSNSCSISIPIGRPIANTQVYILDALQQPVPLGVPGELYIAGEGVAAGYLGAPDRTAERFLHNPFLKNTDALMYRTGDLARYLPSGDIEFLGRADDQVKIRGFRIELGEIEAVLSMHLGVKQAVVLAREDHSGDKRLLAYVVSRPENAVSGDELRVYLKQQLPDYMVPASITLLPKIPLTANGKIDRQALPDPTVAETKIYFAPTTPTQEVVSSIWEEVLRLDRISTQENFFDLGGHSLLATQVISRIRRILKADLPLRILFEAPTIAEIAERIDDILRDPMVVHMPPITAAPRDQDLPLSFAQQRLWVLDQMEPNNPLYNIPRRVRMHGALDVDALTKALNEIVQRHESQRTTFSVRNGHPVQIIARTLIIDVTIRDLSTVSEEGRVVEAQQIAAEDALIPFDLATGPLLRATLLKLASDDHILLLTMHHIVSDAWSAGIFFEEFSSLYENFIAGQPPQLPDLAIQYADYSAWQRKWFRDDVLNHQLAYWREQLRGAPPVLQLPIDRPRTKIQTFQGAHETISFSPETSNALKVLGRHEGTTLFMTLLAGFQALLSRYSGEDQIVVGTDLANRTTTDTERLIGFFINLLAIRTDLSGDPTFRELLGRVREVALGAYAHQEMPFDKLVEELQPERSLSHNPLVQVLFVMQNIPRQRRELSGLSLQPFELPITRSKFDLAVFMVDGDKELSSHWLYSTDLFDKTTIRRMADHFERLLASAIAQPDARLSALEMLSEEEKQQQDADKKLKKQSQLKKLITAAPKGVSLQNP